jgi:hypothetical protein
MNVQAVHIHSVCFADSVRVGSDLLYHGAQAKTMNTNFLTIIPCAWLQREELYTDVTTVYRCVCVCITLSENMALLCATAINQTIPQLCCCCRVLYTYYIHTHLSLELTGLLC